MADDEKDEVTLDDSSGKLTFELPSWRTLLGGAALFLLGGGGGTMATVLGLGSSGKHEVNVSPVACESGLTEGEMHALAELIVKYQRLYSVSVNRAPVPHTNEL